jgi:hypothetical protein
LLLAACAEHGDEVVEDDVQEIPATFVSEVDRLEAACRAAGPVATNLLVDKVPGAAPNVDAISERVVAACLERGDLGQALCIGEATSLPTMRRCAPEWAMPWLGIESCDAYFHDIICVLGHVAPESEEVADALFQAIDAWFQAGLPEMHGIGMAHACEQALDAIVELPQADSCFTGRSLGHGG